MQQKQHSPITRGRKPSGSQKKERNHYITPDDRQYLLCSKEDRKIKYSKATRGRIDLKVERWAKKALKDLTLVAWAYDKKKNEKIFSIDIMTWLLRAVISKQGRDITNLGKYYQVLIQEIAATMVTDLGATKTMVECNIIESPLAKRPFGDIDLETADERERRNFLKYLQTDTPQPYY